MYEYASVSASAYDTTSLVTKLNDKAKDGWDVISIVPTGGDLTAFLKREGDASAAATDTSADVAAPAAAAAAAATTEPAGWAAAPEETPPSPDNAPIDAAPAAEAAAPAAAAAAAQPQAPPATVPSTPSGWYPDPSGRYEMRYWDGEKWTEHVSRQGQTFTDPPVA
jgi:hypothetical protein